MKLLYPLIFLFAFSVSSCENPSSQDIAIVIHGGAGGIDRSYFSEEQIQAYEAKLTQARDAGYQVLDNGGSSLDAVQAAIIIMEDSPLFNAGKGAVFTADGQNELDASIMYGADLNTGAIAGVHHIKNPILAARMVMDKSDHVLLAGDGAEILAKQHGIEMVDASYFFTQKRYDQLLKIQGREETTLDHGDSALNERPSYNDLMDDHKYGTVGAVAIDKEGNIAAGTSTGGMTNKKYGRIGDAPLIGSGTYANNLTCGLSCTGTGEYFIRTLASHEISAKMKYENKSLKEAMHEVIFNQIGPLGGEGGIIGLDKDANVVWDFNSSGMFRAYKSSKGSAAVEMFEQTKMPIN